MTKIIYFVLFSCLIMTSCSHFKDWSDYKGSYTIILCPHSYKMENGIIEWSLDEDSGRTIFDSIDICKQPKGIDIDLRLNKKFWISHEKYLKHLSELERIDSIKDKDKDLQYIQITIINTGKVSKHYNFCGLNQINEYIKINHELFGKDWWDVFEWRFKSKK